MKNEGNDEIDYGQNWSKNIQFHAEKVIFPTSIDEVVAIVKNPNYTSLKAFGSRHCFNNIADTAIKNNDLGDNTISSVHIGMEKMTRIEIHHHHHHHHHHDAATTTTTTERTTTTTTDHHAAPTVEFEAGVTFTQLMDEVGKAGYALTNMPSLPHISVVGGILTGTHGSGITNGIIAKSVVEMKIVHPNGELKVYHRHRHRHDKDSSPNNNSNNWIHLGALGVVVSVTMELEKDYFVAKGIYLDLPYQVFLDNIEEIIGPKQEAEFVSVFMDWKAPRMNSIWVGKKYYNNKEGGDDHGDDHDQDVQNPPVIPDTFFGAKHIPGNQFHPVPLQDPEACTKTGYGRWRDKLCHFLPDHPPSSAGNEIQAEYFLPYSKFKSAMEALWAIRDVFQDLVQITELRAMARDNLPMSQAKNEAAVGIHFTLFKASPDLLNKVLGQVEDVLTSFDYRVHWGKWFVCRGKQLEQMYGDDLIRLRELIKKYDPRERFVNDYLQSCIMDSTA